MSFQEGDRYACPDPSCGCEVTVTKSAQRHDAGDQAPTCCGHAMEKVA